MIDDQHKEIVKLREELEVTRGRCWNPNSQECEFCREADRKLALLLAVAMAAKEAIVIIGFAEAQITSPEVMEQFNPIKDNLLSALYEARKEGAI